MNWITDMAKETGGTLINYKRLSWQGTKQRAEEVLEARKRVQTRPYGAIPTITPPVKVASLLEDMLKHSKTLTWYEDLCKEVAEYREMRRDQRKQRETDLLMGMVKGAT